LIGFDGGDSSEEVDVDVVDRVCFLGFWRDRGESSEEEVDEDEVSIGRNAHSAMPLSFGARGQ
jgi:hypothetical protein